MFFFFVVVVVHDYAVYGIPMMETGSDLLEGYDEEVIFGTNAQPLAYGTCLRRTSMMVTSPLTKGAKDQLERPMSRSVLRLILHRTALFRECLPRLTVDTLSEG